MADEFKRVGESLSLDFHNTASWAGDDVVGDEKLTAYADLLAWAKEAGLVADADGRKLSKSAVANPRRAARVFKEALGLRKAIHLVYSPIADGRAPPAAALAAFNEMLGKLRVRIRPTGTGRFEWDWSDEGPALHSVLWPILWDSAALLQAEDDAARVKKCAGDACGWLFLDTSRRGNRRWCDMADCGNRAKVRRFHERHGRRGRG